MKIIVIGDSHSKPIWYHTKNKDGHYEKRLVEMAWANRRYDWAAQVIINEMKTMSSKDELVIVDIGDFADMKSLSSYDKGKRPSENERIQLDLDYAQDARRRVTEPVLAYLKKKKSQHRPGPKVRWIACLGNHENRWQRLKKDEPTWDMFDSLDDLSLAKPLGWEVYPFLQPVQAGGVWFSHYFESGPKGFAISGVNPGRALIQKLGESCVVGHSHEFHIFRQSSVIGYKIGMAVGCFFEHDEDYAGIQGNPRWWRGLVVMDDVENGNFEERKLSMAHIKKLYYDKATQGPFDLASLDEKRYDVA